MRGHKHINKNFKSYFLPLKFLHTIAPEDSFYSTSFAFIDRNLLRDRTDLVFPFSGPETEIDIPEASRKGLPSPPWNATCKSSAQPMALHPDNLVLTLVSLLLPVCNAFALSAAAVRYVVGGTYS